MSSALALSSMERRVRLALDQFVGLHRCVAVLERDLAEFVEFYLSALGRQAATPSDEAPVLSPLPHRMPDREASRQLYRSVARRCHPDALGEDRPEMRGLFARASDAYARRDLCALQQLEWEAYLSARDTLAAEDRRRFLESTYQRLLTVVAQLTQHWRALQAHPARRLQTLVERAYARGVDLIDELRIRQDIGVPLHRDRMSAAFA